MGRMSLKVFADLMSQPARAVVIFCRAAGIPHEHVGVRITAGDTKTEEYTKMNPLQKVPVIKDGDFVLTESVAMFRYLAREKSVADHWYPSNSKEQARVDEYLEWQHLNTRMMCAGYFIERWLKPMMTKKFNEKSVAASKKSMADILAVCELEQPTMAGYDVTEGREVLGEYVRRVKDELNPHYDEVSAVVYKMRDRMGGNIPGVYPPPADKAKM